MVGQRGQPRQQVATMHRPLVVNHRLLDRAGPTYPRGPLHGVQGGPVLAGGLPRLGLLGGRQGATVVAASAISAGTDPPRQRVAPELRQLRRRIGLALVEPQAMQRPRPRSPGAP
jgi:hypothetical protein